MPVQSLIVNTHTFAASQFTSHGANSCTVFNGKLLFARGTGVYISEGDTDARKDSLGNLQEDYIDAWAVFPVTDLDYNGMKTPRSLLVDGVINGIVAFSLTDENLVTQQYVSNELKSFTGTKLSLRSDQRSRFFQMKVENIDGSYFSILSADMIFIPGPEARR